MEVKKKRKVFKEAGLGNVKEICGVRKTGDSCRWKVKNHALRNCDS